MGNLGRPGYAQQDTGINLQESLLICIQKKSTSSLPSFLRYCKEIANLLFGQFEYAWLWQAKTILWACRKLVYLHAKKIKFIPPLFLEILQRYCKLVILGTLGSPTKNKSTQLLETLMFICKKINLITKFFLQILHFKESCNLIGQEYLWQLIQNKNFARHEVCNGK